MATTSEWVAVDWGTSNVRAWGIAGDGSTVFSTGSDKGMGRIGKADFPGVLDELIGVQMAGPAEVVICGMAGARQGWREAPYLDTPADLHRLNAGSVRPEGADARFDVRILPGVCQRQAGHEDVMRGEETQLLGLLHLQPGFSGTAILPGTHSKWAEIRDGRLVRFSSAMTGELYELFAEHSVLRHALTGDRTGPANEEGLGEGIQAGLARPDMLTSLVFRTRAAGLLSAKGSDWCSGYLSGLLIATEVAGHRDWLDGAPVPLVGSERLSRTYCAALKRLGIESLPIDAANATIEGLKGARAQ